MFLFEMYSTVIECKDINKFFWWIKYFGGYFHKTAQNWSTMGKEKWKRAVPEKQIEMGPVLSHLLVQDTGTLYYGWKYYGEMLIEIQGDWTRWYHWL